MTGTAGCREIRQLLGVYVLGAIDPAERALVDEHLASCLDCREDLAALAGLPAMLRKIPVAEAERLVAEGSETDSAAPEELLHSLLVRTSRVRQARRWRGLAAAAAVILAALGGGAAVASALQPGHAPGPGATRTAGWQLVSATARTTGVRLTVRYHQETWGTEMEVNVSGVKPGTLCQFQLTDRSGAVWPVGSWQVTRQEASAWYPVSTSVRDKDLRSFELTTGSQLLAKVRVS